MKLASYFHEEEIEVGVVQEEEIIEITPYCGDMLGLIYIAGQEMAMISAWKNKAKISYSLDEVKLLAPIPRPTRNIMCLGLNYAEHAAEHYSASGKKTTLPEFPIIFTKATTSINGPYDPIPYDHAVTQELDWEVELAVVIGQKGKNIPGDKAMEYVFGYSIINDVSARELQRNHKQFFKGKSLDGACPMGPWIVTADELTEPHQLSVTTRVNGVVKQDSSTQFMIFDIPEIIAQLSLGMTLLPGDIIATGTPSGVGFARTPPEFLYPGDVVECEIENIGKISNLVKNVSSN